MLFNYLAENNLIVNNKLVLLKKALSMYYFILSVQQRLFLPGLQIPVAKARFTKYFLNKKNPLTLLILLNIERYFKTLIFHCQAAKMPH